MHLFWLFSDLTGEDLEKHLRAKKKKFSKIETRVSFDVEMNARSISEADDALRGREKELVCLLDEEYRRSAAGKVCRR